MGLEKSKSVEKGTRGETVEALRMRLRLYIVYLSCFLFAAAHLRFHAVREFLNLVRFLYYIQRQDIFVGFPNVVVQFGREPQQSGRVAFQVRLALLVGLLLHALLHIRRDTGLSSWRGSPLHAGRRSD